MKGPGGSTRNATASRAGDEPLLLCRTAPVWIAGNRAAGASVGIEHGAEVLVMDDGFQNATIDKTASVIVIDGGFGFGNGATIPAGPLREPISDGLDRADAVVIIGPDDHDVEAAIRSRAPGLRILKARVRPTKGAAAIEGKNVFAFAGIGRPEKFYRTLEELGCDIRARRNFGDHHPYGRADIQPILDRAKDLGAIPVTTANIRIQPQQRRGTAPTPNSPGKTNKRSTHSFGRTSTMVSQTGTDRPAKVVYIMKAATAYLPLLIGRRRLNAPALVGCRVIGYRLGITKKARTSTRSARPDG